jgi:hypothetical protein
MRDVLSLPDSRQDPPSGEDERTTLIDFLDLYRETVLVKLDGLDRAAVTRRPLPSYTSLLGIVRHLIRVEIYWFSIIFLGEPDPDEDDADYSPNDDWVIGDTETSEQLIGEYRSVCARSNEIARAASSLDEVSRSKSRDGKTLRWILVHMVDETARHAGHADIVRELIDGRTGE